MYDMVERNVMRCFGRANFCRCTQGGLQLIMW